MERSEIQELHYIAPKVNLASILKLGILSHHRAEKVPHSSLAAPEVQLRRYRLSVPGKGRPLHDFANLYFNARNRMMYRLQEAHEDICIIRVRPEVLDLAGVIVTDMNASVGAFSDKGLIAHFYPAAEGINKVEGHIVFYRGPWWGDWAQKSMAEVLIADAVAPTWVTGAYVSVPDATTELLLSVAGLSCNVRPRLFFQ
jgi:hypothetical protein